MGLSWSLVNNIQQWLMFFFNRRLVGTLCQPNGVFFLFCPQTGGYFFPTLKKIILKKTKIQGGFFPTRHY
jgi:hypothetical protein